MKSDDGRIRNSVSGFNKFISEVQKEQYFCTSSDSGLTEKYKNKKWCRYNDKEKCRTCGKRLTKLLENDLLSKNREIVFYEKRGCLI
ncbi:MAG: hypothetical protein WCY05_06730 [Candidatus Omnitrophota bacterium]